MTTQTIRAAGATDVGRQRDVNEDRFHIDRDRRVFMVVDGVGGQAAGGRAADTALEMIRARLARETGPLPNRVREAITIANNEVFRQASARPEWRGMACVLTVAVVDNGRAVVGHVGDTRLYKLRNGGMHKVTPDHSPVGEREDAGELSEHDAMRHPRRNEVYRDVGSQLREPDDSEFVDVIETSWEPDAALLLCSDGLTDLVPADGIHRIVRRHAGDAQAVARALVKAANEAGGKDNITVVYVEGERFPVAAPMPPRSRRVLAHVLVWLMAIAAGIAAWRYYGSPVPELVTNALGAWAGNAIVVRAGDSIARALEKVTPGGTIVVEPGEYRERLTLKDDVRIVSRVRREAVLRLPESFTDQDAAVTALNVRNAELIGFRIVGDAQTPLGTGIAVRSSGVRVIDVEVTGAASAAVDIGGPGDVLLHGSHIHDNPGAGLAVRKEAAPHIAHNSFAANGLSGEAGPALLIEAGARPFFQKNVFEGFDPHAVTVLDATLHAQLKNDNWFPRATATPPAGRPARDSGQQR